MRLFCTLFLLVTIMGCASYPEPEEYRALLRSGDALTVSEPARFEFQQVALGENTEFELGGSRKAHDFGGGLTLYEAFLVPESKNIEVEVSSLFSGFQQAWEHITIPTLLFLDANYSEVTRVVSSMEQGRTGGGSTLFRHTMLVPEKSKYLILYVDPAADGTKHQWHYSLFVATGKVAAKTDDPGSLANVGIGGPVQLIFRSR